MGKKKKKPQPGLVLDTAEQDHIIDGFLASMRCQPPKAHDAVVAKHATIFDVFSDGQEDGVLPAASVAVDPSAQVFNMAADDKDDNTHKQFQDDTRTPLVLDTAPQPRSAWADVDPVDDDFSAFSFGATAKEVTCFGQASTDFQQPQTLDGRFDNGDTPGSACSPPVSEQARLQPASTEMPQPGHPPQETATCFGTGSPGTSPGGGAPLASARVALEPPQGVARTMDDGSFSPLAALPLVGGFLQQAKAILPDVYGASDDDDDGFRSTDGCEDDPTGAVSPVIGSGIHYLTNDEFLAKYGGTNASDLQDYNSRLKDSNSQAHGSTYVYDATDGGATSGEIISSSPASGCLCDSDAPAGDDKSSVMDAHGMNRDSDATAGGDQSGFVHVGLHAAHAHGVGHAVLQGECHSTLGAPSVSQDCHSDGGEKSDLSDFNSQGQGPTLVSLHAAQAHGVGHTSSGSECQCSPAASTGSQELTARQSLAQISQLCGNFDPGPLKDMLEAFVPRQHALYDEHDAAHRACEEHIRQLLSKVYPRYGVEGHTSP